ncbi:TonB-dependent receptor [Sphingomonas canadensis]|uniref:TonB-dependent receptor n=1 Tax=Sphingomonas canadensis TaxID=1219257 RepID=A0ABW3H268_9SPHN|nr:TonB-dependent receptor [Sphingomonas canadensis]MCW3834530.1 TonB-dependent receptor [Sphingomonas canadensis]
MIALCATLGATAAQAQASDDPADQSSEGDIVVTARFREETVQDIGGSISAIDGRAIAREGIDEFEDIARRTPGLSTIDRGPSQNDVSVRGISNGVSPRLSDLGGSGPLVSQFLDDIPVAAATASQRDFNYFDFDRIEVLRGPQPTLFGEGSVGGTIRYFSRDPNLGGALASDMVFQSSLSFTDEGGTNVAASAASSFILVPDRLGIRAVVNYRKDDGFIDNPRLGIDNFNDYRAFSGRVVALWKPTDDLSIRLMAFAGRDDFGGSYEVNAPPAAKTALVLSTPVQGDNRDKFELYTGKVEYDAGPVTLTAITGWYTRSRRDEFFDAQSAAAFGLFTTVLTATGLSNADDESFTQELRFATDLGGAFDLIGGVYYQDASYIAHLTTTAPEFAPYTTPVGGTTLIGQAGSVDSRQISGFVEGTLRASERLRLIAGVRYVDEKITSVSIQSIAAFGGAPNGLAPPFVIADVNATATAAGIPLEESFQLRRFLPRAAIELDVGDDAMLYAIAATGVRNGNLNPFTSALRGAGTPPSLARFEQARSFREDEVLSFEIGAKTRWLDDALTLNVSAFHTDFKDPQILTANPFVLTLNGPDLEIYGVELQSSWRAARGVNFYLSGTWQDASFQSGAALANPATLAALGFTEDLQKGNRPVNTPEWAAAAGVDIRQPVDGDLSVTANLSYQYIGSRFALSQNYPSSRMGAQNFVNLRVGLESEHWSLTAFVDNLTNEIEYQAIQGNTGTPILNAGKLDFRPTSVSVNRPRTIGIQFGTRF